MLRAVALLASLAVLAAPALAADKETDCLPVPGIGCWYAPDGAPADAPLLVYLRGHHPAYGPSVPPEQYLDSSRRAFSMFGLEAIARGKGAVLLVTYRSGLGVTPADIAALALTAKRSFPKTFVAAHSGGYKALEATLAAGVVPSRVVLLDSFYGADDGLAQTLQRLISTGTGCAGFYTPHNKANYDAAFKNGISCVIDAFDSDSQHNPAVGRCLAGYLEGRSCK